MKFTKEQAIESLNSELTNKGKKTLRMSKRTLETVVDALLPKFADDDTGLPDFITAALEILNPMNDNIGKDRSDFIKQWEKDHQQTPPTDPVPPTDPAPPTPPTPPANPNDPMFQMLQAMQKQLKEMQDERAAEQATKKLNDKKAELLDACKKKGITDDAWLASLMSEVTIAEDVDVEKKAESWLGLYNKSLSSVQGAEPPANPTNPRNKIGDNDSLARAKALAKAQYDNQQ